MRLLLKSVISYQLSMPEDKHINDLYLKIASLERRISKLELGLEEHDRVIDPQGWIGEAFERVYEDIDNLETKLDSANHKLDTIVQRLTGISEGKWRELEFCFPAIELLTEDLSARSPTQKTLPYDFRGRKN